MVETIFCWVTGFPFDRGSLLIGEFRGAHPCSRKLPNAISHSATTRSFGADGKCIHCLEFVVVFAWIHALRATVRRAEFMPQRRHSYYFPSVLPEGGVITRMILHLLFNNILLISRHLPKLLLEDKLSKWFCRVINFDSIYQVCGIGNTWFETLLYLL